MNKHTTLAKSAIAIVALGLSLSLTACKTTGKNAAAGDANGAAGGDNAAVAQGVGEQAGFDGAQGAAGAGANAANRLKAPYNQTYYFDFDKNDVYQADYASIQAQATYLIAHPSAKVELQGNTDDRGSREYNIALGWRRAKAVQAILEQDGVSPSQISTLSYGAEKPVALGENEEAWRLNRRVELVYKSY